MIEMIEIAPDHGEKSALPETMVRQMYELLGGNMTQIMGESDSTWRSDAEFLKWKNNVFLGAVHSNTSHILLIDQNGLRGFLSYTVAPEANEIYLNEIQIRPSCQCDGVTLRSLLRSFADRVRELPQDQVRAYSNKANTRVHGLVAKIGFEKIGETDRGYQYRIPKSRLDWRWMVR